MGVWSGQIPFLYELLRKGIWTDPTPVAHKPSTRVLQLSSLSFAILVHTAPCCPTMSSLQRRFGLPTDLTPCHCRSVLLMGDFKIRIFLIWQFSKSRIRPWGGKISPMSTTVTLSLVSQQCQHSSQLSQQAGVCYYRTIHHQPPYTHHTDNNRCTLRSLSIIIIMSVFLESLSMWNMLNCAEQAQIQKYKTHAYKTPKTACVQSIMLKQPTKQ